MVGEIFDIKYLKKIQIKNVSKIKKITFVNI